MSDWFAAPQWAWALLAVPCVYLFARAMESARKARIAFHLGPRFAAEDAADFGTAAWLATATLGCVLAAMQPQWGVEAARAERRGTDLVVGVDVSRSSRFRITEATREISWVRSTGHEPSRSGTEAPPSGSKGVRAAQGVARV